MTQFRNLIFLARFVLFISFIIWNSGQEFLSSGDGKFEANGDEFGPLLSKFELTLPNFNLNKPGRYKYQLTSFFK